MPKLVRTFTKADRIPPAPVASQENKRKPEAQHNVARRELHNRQKGSLEAARKGAVNQSRTTQTLSSGDARLWLAFLNEVNYVGGEASMSDVRQRLRHYNLRVPDDQSAADASAAQDSWNTCITSVRTRLIQRGCLLGASRGVVQLTELGKCWLDANWRGPDRKYAKVTKPPVLDRDARPEKTARDSTSIRSSRQKARSTDEARLVRRRIKIALIGMARPDRDAVDHYLLGVMAVELNLPSDAATLLGVAIEVGLDEKFLAKALHLREHLLAQGDQERQR